MRGHDARVLGAAQSLLKAADARLAQHCRVRAGSLPTARLSLDPSREEATTALELHRLLEPRVQTEAASLALASGLAATADAICRHFPDNLLWDLDALAAGLVARGSDAAGITRAFDEMCGLISLFGRATAIRFRYMHDFTYGFDWAKWVRREPETRAGIGPFDERLVAALFRRGNELLALIDADDAKYGRLPDARARNPFGFSREPADEIRLFRALVEDGLVPLCAWQLDPRPVWDRPFADLRAAHRASARLPDP